MRYEECDFGDIVSRLEFMKAYVKFFFQEKMISLGTINLNGLPNINWAELMSLPKKYWVEDMEETKRFFEQQVGHLSQVLCNWNYHDEWFQF